MSQTKTLPLKNVVRRVGETAWLKGTITSDTISGTPAWAATATGFTKSATVTTTTTSTSCVYTFTAIGTYIVNCTVVTTGGQTWVYGWRVSVSVNE